MGSSLYLLSSAAASIAFIHTILGPDHYLPFFALSKSNQWTLKKTVVITLLCGLGHVFGSILIGAIGLVIGSEISSISFIETKRGTIAAWFLLFSGFIYMIWGLKKAIDGHKHTHSHRHPKNINIHSYLFIFFILGPCEPLIPILMYPAATQSTYGVILVTLIFSIVTIVTMTAMVIVFFKGISLFSLKSFEKYTHFLAGAIIFLSGLAIIYLGV